MCALLRCSLTGEPAPGVVVGHGGENRLRDVSLCQRRQKALQQVDEAGASVNPELGELARVVREHDLFLVASVDQIADQVEDLVFELSKARINFSVCI